MPFKDELTIKITNFLAQIGIGTIPAKLTDETFLPGIMVKNGKLLIDEEKLEFPGDLLHEAGHLAVAPAIFRDKLSDEVVVPDFIPEMLETQAILWSYAACIHLEIEPRIVFHEFGYKGKSESLLLNFSLGVYIGLNSLEENKMAFSQIKATKIGFEPFPKMQKWLCD